ncbi:MAG: L-serine ammonia-lyase, iron-sulfur-dependent, subunit alpha [bacterium]|nr:L-serine ammonia-lyase, iron-sulfur-dependent, subunit alpha [bacterium]
MKTLKDLYKAGNGPSSSHTMGPSTAGRLFLMEYPDADSYKVILYDSLAKTGKGHRTDRALLMAFEPHPLDIVFDPETTGLPHPNTLDFYAYKDGNQVGYWRVLSVGGGAIQIVGREAQALPEIYDLNSFHDISEYCRNHNIRIWQYVDQVEGPDIWNYLADVWTIMKTSIAEGLAATGVLPGIIKLERKANYLYNQRHIDESPQTKEMRIVCSYAYAVTEQNAANGIVVTAPTCGACGVVPAVLKYMQDKDGFSDEEILHALATGGIIGNLIKTNASISGAECGCQAEVGSACCMAAAALGELFGLGLNQIEYAAEVAMEHHLGLTCDPVKGMVQIPCIERNAVAAMRAINALTIANFLSDTRKISFDTVIETMYQTGKDMHSHYKETSEGGLARTYKFDDDAKDEDE